VFTLRIHVLGPEAAVDSNPREADLSIMVKHAKIRLSRRRDIGWRCWDPIALGGPNGDWADSAAADEYDGYLLQVARMVCQNEGDDAAAQHLVWAESERTGLGVRADTLERARATIAAIRADDQLWNEG
jgi:hypothetical protein